MTTDQIPSHAKLSAFLAERIEAGDFPSAVYLISERGRPAFAGAVGNSVVDPYRIEATPNTIYDLASLTKPLITGLLCSKRIELGELGLDSSIANYLLEFDRPDRSAITVRQLLTHTSGLAAWRPLYILAEGERGRAIGELANAPLEYSPGTRVVYSDLGFIALGIMLERLTGKQLSVLAREEIFGPLKLEHSYFNPERALQTGIAACETGNVYERNTSIEAGLPEYQNWRQGLIWGEVHDGNAYFLGGLAGHAGLFADARDTMTLANQFLANQTKTLRPETCEMFRSNMTEGLEEARSIAWQLASSPGSSAGAALPRDSFGHSGFTGTSCWIDPLHERVFILLTNRTHARKLPFENINAVRRQFNTLAVAAFEE